MGTNAQAWKVIGWTLCLALTACGADRDDSGGPVAPTDSSGCSLATVQSDYQSTSISLLEDDGTLCADTVLHSGSVAPQLLTALSGDVVVPSTSSPRGELVLIDRYPNGVITFFDTVTSSVTSQISVAAGFASNPQDIAFVSETKAYVSRSETNPNPTQQLEDFDDGGDVLVIDLEAGTVTSRIDMHPYADASTIPRPVGFAMASNQVWVALANLARDFQSAGPGTVVAIDSSTESVEYVLTIDGLVNCGNLAVVPDGTGLWGTCNGLFAEGGDQQRQRSGLFYIDLTGGEPVLSWTRSGDALAGQVIGFGVAPLSATRALFVALGQLGDNPVDDRIMVVDRASGEVVDVGVSAGAYELGTPHISRGSTVLVPVASAVNPRIERLLITDAGELVPADSVYSNPSVGLPPRSVGRFSVE